MLDGVDPADAEQVGDEAARARPAGRDAPEQVAERVLRASPVVDGHNDLPWAIRESRSAPLDVAAYDLRGRAPGHNELARLREGRVGGQFWSVYIPGAGALAGVMGDEWFVRRIPLADGRAHLSDELVVDMAPMIGCTPAFFAASEKAMAA